MLKSSYTNHLVEAGCDEAGRGCLAGPVFAAAVILPADFSHAGLNDSKQLSPTRRESLRQTIENEALAWAIAMVDNHEIDRINILKASILAMHKALDQLLTRPQLILVDGNHFKAYPDIPHECIVKGDSKYMSIAAASILAKTYRDDFMMKLHETYPHFGWDRNKGYPTLEHRKAILTLGLTPYHRETFTVQVNDV